MYFRDADKFEVDVVNLRMTAGVKEKIMRIDHKTPLDKNAITSMLAGVI
jgi:hypothetical protein